MFSSIGYIAHFSIFYELRKATYHFIYLILRWEFYRIVDLNELCGLWFQPHGTTSLLLAHHSLTCRWVFKDFCLCIDIFVIISPVTPISMESTQSYSLENVVLAISLTVSINYEVKFWQLIVDEEHPLIYHLHDAIRGLSQKGPTCQNV